MLIRVALMQVSDRELAEELVQETLLQEHRASANRGVAKRVCKCAAHPFADRHPTHQERRV